MKKWITFWWSWFPGLQSEYKFADRNITIFIHLWYKNGSVLKNGVLAMSLALSPQIPLHAISTVSPRSSGFIKVHSIAAWPDAQRAIVKAFRVWNKCWIPTFISSIIVQKSGWRWPKSGYENYSRDLARTINRYVFYWPVWVFRP